jgi:hypothetical protein
MVLIKIVIPIIKPLSLGMTRTPVSNKETHFHVRIERVKANGEMDQASTNIAQLPVMPNAGKFIHNFSIVTQPCPTDSLTQISMMTRTTLASMVK